MELDTVTVSQDADNFNYIFKIVYLRERIFSCSLPYLYTAQQQYKIKTDARYNLSEVHHSSRAGLIK